MNIIGAAVTDVGNVKQTNQDSACIKVANTDHHGQIAMAVLCDGMGGLDKGELASATVIRAFISWFENDLPKQIDSFSMQDYAAEWERIIKEQNYRISQFGKQIETSMGTTVTAMFIKGEEYIIAHVGDSRVYEISKGFRQLTEDQTFIAREIKNGRMTREQAAKDPRRNMLLQCVGASKNVEPQIVTGAVKEDTVFMFCSDGFRHVLSDEEMFTGFNLQSSVSFEAMQQNCRRLIDVVKDRNERDNITVALLKCTKGA